MGYSVLVLVAALLIDACAPAGPLAAARGEVIAYNGSTGWSTGPR